MPYLLDSDVLTGISLNLQQAIDYVDTLPKLPPPPRTAKPPVPESSTLERGSAGASKTK